MRVPIKPTRLPGRWRLGYALDFHTRSSRFTGYDEFGHPQFETKRTPLGELLYQLKYEQDARVVAPIVGTIVTFLRSKFTADVIVPVPASRRRRLQPLLLIATELSARLDVPVCSVARRRENSKELKSLSEYDERLKALESSLYLSNPEALSGKRVLILDDLWRSGATLNAVATIIIEGCLPSDVFALSITRTRSNR